MATIESIFPATYDVSQEEEMYDLWLQHTLFTPETARKYQQEGGFAKEETFSIGLPPPNVTGTLHLGHAMMLAVEDTMIRHARMQGKETLRIPGTDHAGIATQVVVEKKIAKEENLTRHDLGREAFLAKVWDRVRYSRATIVSQTKRLGSSLDWSREQFTMSERLSRAVRKSFVTLANQKKIYNDAYIVNRCPRCQTVLSDLEVVYNDITGKLYYVQYFIPGTKEAIPVATSRPETMF